MSRVFIGVGHGGSDAGAVGYIVEKDGALVIATACKDYLIANGVEVRMSRYIDEDESLREKINEALKTEPLRQDNTEEETALYNARDLFIKNSENHEAQSIDSI